MKVEKFDGSTERHLLAALILDKVVLASVAPQWDSDGMFASTWCNMVGKWCVDHFRKHGKAPNKAIRIYYRHWADKSSTNHDSIDQVEKFLISLDEEFSSWTEADANSTVMVDLAARHFGKIRYKKYAERIIAAVDSGEDFKLDEIHRTFKKVSIGDDDCIDVLHDDAVLEEAFAQKDKSIVEFCEGLREFYGTSLGRGCFISYLAPEKRGKSWMLLDMAWRAMEQRKRVLFFEVGDMTRAQIMKRFLIRAAAHPSRAISVKYPTELIKSDDQWTTSHLVKEFEFPLDETKAKEERDKVLVKRMRTKDYYLKLKCTPAATMTVSRMKAIADNLINQGWVPDLVIVDYADLIAPAPGTGIEMRDKINNIWMQLRGLSQELNCLLVTATQANRSAYKTNIIGMEHSSEDKRKVSHVTGMIGINSTEKERPYGILRLNWVALREDEFDPLRPCYVATCLPLGNPCVRSVYPFKGAKGKD